MSQIVNLNYASPSTEAYIDYLWPILFPEANLDNAEGSERLLDNAFGTWVEDNDSLSIENVTVDLSYNNNSLNVSFSLNGEVVTETDLIFNASFSGSISHEFDTWSYLARNTDLISIIGTDKGKVAQHYLKFGINEGRSAETFNYNHYLASNTDLIPVYGLNPKLATQHYVEYGFNEQRATSSFNEFVYLGANPDILPSSNTWIGKEDLKELAQEHYITYGYLEGRDSNIISFLSDINSDYAKVYPESNVYSTSYLNIVEDKAQSLVYDYINFDHHSYLASNLDLFSLGVSKINLYKHYKNYGEGEGRSLDSFNEFEYLIANQDLISAFGLNGELATRHYIKNGIVEGRPTTPSDDFEFSLSGYLVSNPDVLDSIYKDKNSVYSNPVYSDLYISFYSNENYLSYYNIENHSSFKHYFTHGYLEDRKFNSFDNSAYIDYLRETRYTDGNVVLMDFWHPYGNFRLDEYEEVATDYISNYINFNDLNYLASNEDLITNLVGIDSKFNVFNHYISFGYKEERTLDSFDVAEYLASNSDLINAFGYDRTKATKHYVQTGYLEGRSVDSFDEWGYLASNSDLINAFGSNTTEAIQHFIFLGMSEGRRTDGFNAESYLNNYADLRNAFGNDQELATKHYVEYGFNEGRVF